jgi:hypothetical protein
MTAPDKRPIPTVAAVLIGCLGGLLLGTMGAFVQAARWLIADFSIPWGTLVVLAGLVVAIRAGIALVGSRWGGVCVFAGWLAATVIFSTRTPWSGDLIIAPGTWQFVYLFGGLILGSAAATIAARNQRGRISP